MEKEEVGKMEKESRAFLTELTKYYMEFLENDFKVSTPPSRRIKAEDKQDGSAVAALQDFPTWNKRFDTLFENNVIHYDFPEIKKGNPFYAAFQAMVRNKELADGKEFYFYFLTMEYKKNSYPLFYVRFDVEETEQSSFQLTFDPVLFINKKAISYLGDQYKKETNAPGIVQLPPRHVYMEMFKEKGALLAYLQQITQTITTYFALPDLDVTDPTSQVLTTQGFTLSNARYFHVFDKSDEMILNDYETFLNLLQKGANNDAFQGFSNLLHEFLHENPITVESAIEQHYDQASLSERFTYYSPIPLNKEQQLALLAIDHPDAKRIVIEGPPGTGKSHTITAIIYDALLRKKSVLVVSDKEEALDVVEDKINQALDRVKLNDFVQNPVLRLGKKNNNYQKIFSGVNFSKIKTRQRAYRNEQGRIERDIDQLLSKMKHDIDSEVEASKQVTVSEVQALLAYEPIYETHWQALLSPIESCCDDDVAQQISDYWYDVQTTHTLLATLQQHGCVLPVQNSLEQVLFAITSMLGDVEKVRIAREKVPHPFVLSEHIHLESLDIVEEVLDHYEVLKQPLFGTLFARKKVKELERTIKNHFPLAAFTSLKKQHESLQSERYFYKYCTSLDSPLDLLALLRTNALDTVQETLQQLHQTIQSIKAFYQHHPALMASMHVQEQVFSTYVVEQFATSTKEDMAQLIDFLLHYGEIIDLTNKMIAGEYHQDRTMLEERLVLKMTNILDERVIEFRENYRNDAAEIRTAFQQKKQISKEHLRKLIHAFPCLLVGIRELGEFVPLEPNLFDVVIIDEASQVSIAQAFPAILRAKKVVVLGDSKQFSNVKSHNASKEINQALFQRVKRTMATDKVDHFNVKNSILEFMKAIANHHSVLKKHFRGYQELIDYSNVHFYDQSLEVMKIRTKPIQDVLVFHEVPPQNDTKKNVNEAEAAFILQALVTRKQQGQKGTIGIITPFRDQQKWIATCLLEHPDYAYFKQEFKLKVMTFDTCQGEERDLIYYSMVEKEGEDTLKYIFPIDFAQNSDNIKTQRLNVGLSRAKETAVFVCSKSLSSFRGEIGRALRHFHLHQTKQDPYRLFSQTDPASPMEQQLLQWILQTPFYQTNQQEIELIPQFNIGEYIKQLDHTATLPNYRTDFLLIYRNQVVILEYDGFEFHFETVNNATTQEELYLYTEQDIERQKTIESYGYPFIRMNKFIMKKDPILFLEQQFNVHFRESIKKEDVFQTQFATLYGKIEQNEMKECTKCGQLKPLASFFDPTLKTSYGRICTLCKKK